MIRLQRRNVLLVSAGATAVLFLLGRMDHIPDGWKKIAAIRGGGEEVIRVREGEPKAEVIVEAVSDDDSDFLHSSTTGTDCSPGSWWYFGRGSVRPTPGAVSAKSLFPSRHRHGDDRITKQLLYSPRREEGHTAKPKKILLYENGWPWVKLGREEFLNKQCPVDACLLTMDKTDPADAVLFKSYAPSGEDFVRPSGQLWILNLLESPLHSGFFGGTDVNWTASYMHDSEIVTPYEKWVYYDPGVKSKTQTRNYAKGKTKKVAWFVSNCGANNGRSEYAKRLAKLIDVDIYGACGSLQCPREEGRCFKMLSEDYKFYLAFENSNCIDYITEKFFVNGLG